MKIYLNTNKQALIRFVFTFLSEMVLPYLIIFGLIKIINFDSFSKINQSALISLIIYWVFLSYVRGRYSQIKSSNTIKNLILEFKELIIISSFSTISLFILRILA